MRMNRRALQLAACGGFAREPAFQYEIAVDDGTIGMVRKRSSDFLETREDVAGRGHAGRRDFLGGATKVRWRDFLKKMGVE